MIRLLERCGFACNVTVVAAIYLATTAFFFSLACLVLLGSPIGVLSWP